MKLTAETLENDFVRLEPLVETHRELTRDAASDPAIWSHWPRDMINDGWDKSFDRQLGEQADGSWMIFTVFDRKAGGAHAIGQTCYLAIEPAHARVEVGGTWYAPQAQATHVNPGSKLLMIGHAFACGAERVELKTDALNARSRAAMLKLGLRHEGVFRRHMRRHNGTWRDTAWYSVIREDWPAMKTSLEARLAGL
ncbi:MAG: GNAT family N-acetyltransferase [Hyphomonadaceae bacterium]